MLIDSALGEPMAMQRAVTESNGLGLFVRSLVGLDRVAAKEAMANFINGKSATARLPVHGATSPLAESAAKHAPTYDARNSSRLSTSSHRSSFHRC